MQMIDAKQMKWPPPNYTPSVGQASACRVCGIR
jgi:hypothetical protein